MPIPCPQVSLTACVVVDTSLGKHGVVLNLRLAHWGTVAADDHQLGCTEQKGIQSSEQPTCAHSMWKALALPRTQHIPGITNQSIQGELLQLLTLARTQSLQAGLVAQSILSGLHHQRQTAVDVFLALLLH